MDLKDGVLIMNSKLYHMIFESEKYERKKIDPKEFFERLEPFIKELKFEFNKKSKYQFQNFVVGEYINLKQLKSLSITTDYQVKRQDSIDLSIFDSILNSHISVLNIANYNIKNFQVIRNLRQLEELSIKGYNFSMADKNTFNELQGLKKLFLEKCDFTEIHTLKDLQQLQLLVLCENNLTNKDFNNCKFRNLQMLDVSHNKLESLDNLQVSEKLYYINASHNNLSTLLYHTDTVLDIEELDISHNTKLQDIRQLKQIPRLSNLNISYTKVNQRNAKILQSLNIQSINVTNVNNEKILDNINTERIENITVNQFDQKIDTSNLIQCVNLKSITNKRAFDYTDYFNCDILTNEKVKQLKIAKVNNLIQINKNNTSKYFWSTSQIFASKAYITLRKYIRNQIQDVNNQFIQRSFVNTLHRVNFLSALQIKQIGILERQEKENNTIKFVNVKKANEQKVKLNKKLKFLLKQQCAGIMIIGFE
ncbi:Conserved_hypothetical protein [Hexamita inflata]|uniref:Uncharacterized protein n=1 Tax=Hexamita inflata TaxID=28002 RepID=A0AA86NCP3_9EUKA|nr:Conserved hypothetical protein [Hexamita inflata]